MCIIVNDPDANLEKTKHAGEDTILQATECCVDVLALLVRVDMAASI